MMPDNDGFEFAENVRRVNRHIPILFMSARDDLPSKQKGFQLGIDDYMVKPVQLDELLRVRALLRHANVEMERKLVVGNLELDADGMTAAIDGGEVPVTTREFNILKMVEELGSITLTETSDERNVYVSVHDTGCGTSEETKKHIFENFYQGDTAHAAAGNGLGLALALRVLQLNGFQIEVESAPSHGSTFTVIMPGAANGDTV